KITDFTDFDVKFPSLGNNAIVFENGGYIYKMDLATEQVEKVTIYLNEDFVSGRGGIKNVSKEISNYSKYFSACTKQSSASIGRKFIIGNFFAYILFREEEELKM